MSSNASREADTGNEAGTDVLVIEDDALLEALLVTGFENEGMAVSSVEHGYDWQAVFERVGRPRVVVVDAVLPCIDGVELGATLDERYDDVTVFVVNVDRQSSPVDLEETRVERRPGVDPVSLVDAVSECL